MEPLSSGDDCDLSDCDLDLSSDNNGDSSEAEQEHSSARKHKIRALHNFYITRIHSLMPHLDVDTELKHVAI